jgi:hypothetical protein
MPAPAPAYAPPPQPLDHFVPGDQPAYAPVAPAGSWRLGDDDIVPGAVAGKRGKKG